MNLYEYVRSGPLAYIDPLGLNVWIEGTDDAGTCHERIVVGDPNANQFAISFGPPTEGMGPAAWVGWGGRVDLTGPDPDSVGNGCVFEDNKKPATGDPEAMIETTPKQDAEIKEWMQSLVHNEGKYFWAGYNCRKFSSKCWHLIVEDLKDGEINLNDDLQQSESSDAGESSNDDGASDCPEDNEDGGTVGDEGTPEDSGEDGASTNEPARPSPPKPPLGGPPTFMVP